MELQTELQLETILQRIFTLNYAPKIVKDSYKNVFLKVAALVFAFFALKLVLVGSQSFVALLAALIVSLLATFVMLSLLSLLRNAHGAKGVLLFSAALLLIAVIIILI